MPSLPRTILLLVLLVVGSRGAWGQVPSAGPVPTVYRFVLTRLPANTPHDAALYLTGSFNSWQPADARYRFRRQADGLYWLTLRSTRPQLEYKVTRGDWASIEGSGHGQVRQNRVATQAEAQAGAVEVRVSSWEDLSGTFQFYSLYDLLLLFSCFQGVLLVVAIPGMQHYNRAANRWLVLLLGLGALLTLLKVASGYRGVANAYPQLALVPDFLWFLYGPLFYFYLRRLLFAAREPARRWAWRFVPAGVQALVYLPYFLLDGYELQLRLVSHEAVLRGVLLGTGLLALLHNGAYWLAGWRTVQAYTRQYEASASRAQNLRYLGTVLGIQAVCLALWAFLFGVVLASGFAAFDVYTLADRSEDAIWLAFSTLPYFLGFVAIHQPEIFKLLPAPAAPAPNSLPAEPAASAAPAGAELLPLAGGSAALPRPAAPKAAPALPDLPALQASLSSYMQQHKPYTNPGLTIHELAAGLKLPPHVLSKVINEGFGKNFFDFVNAYRVEEFKLLMSEPQARQYTLLALALEVGFNSKSSFNRAFKKQTDQTPREYFGGVREE